MAIKTLNHQERDLKLANREPLNGSDPVPLETQADGAEAELQTLRQRIEAAKRFEPRASNSPFRFKCLDCYKAAWADVIRMIEEGKEP